MITETTYNIICIILTLAVSIIAIREVNMIKKIWYFTFGADHIQAHHCQPIKASSWDIARAKMFEMYGSEWCFQYSEQQWEEVVNNPKRFWPMETMLPLVEVEELEEEK